MRCTILQIIWEDGISSIYIATFPKEANQTCRDSILSTGKSMRHENNGYYRVETKLEGKTNNE